MTTARFRTRVSNSNACLVKRLLSETTRKNLLLQNTFSAVQISHDDQQDQFNSASATSREEEGEPEESFLTPADGSPAEDGLFSSYGHHLNLSWKNTPLDVS